MTSEQLASLEHDFGVTANTHDRSVSTDTIDCENLHEEEGSTQLRTISVSVFEGQEIPF